VHHPGGVYPVEIGLSDIGNITRIENMPTRLPDEQKAIKAQLGSGSIALLIDLLCQQMFGNT
jgi:hypothetical protein